MYNTLKQLKIIQQLGKEAPQNQCIRSQLNAPIFKCLLALTLNYTKHSVDQVRHLLYTLLEQLTAQKQKSLLHLATPQTSEVAPFLPPTNAEFTLVLDLDETLIHYVDEGEGHFLIRPGC